MKQVSMSVDCPTCGKKAVMLETVKKIPHFGEALISALSCSNCSFKMADVMSTTFREPARFEFKVRSEADLKRKIVKSGSATIWIPELGIGVEPGTFSQGYISNLEGMLSRFENAIQAVLPSVRGKAKASAGKRLEALKKAKRGGKLFTVILLDPFGNSALLGKRVKRRPLTGKEMKKLRKNIMPA